MTKTTVAVALLLSSLAVGCSASEAKPAASPANGDHATRPLSADEDAAVAEARTEVGPSGLTISDEILALCPQVKPPYFDFDSSAIRSDQRGSLESNAQCYREREAAQVTLEGNCDPRGTTEYNYALGERRAHAVKRVLSGHGIRRGSLRNGLVNGRPGRPRLR